MSSEADTENRQRLHFFGKMNSSISHELKNVLAIINENAGLLEDFAMLAERGTPIDSKRLKTIAAKISTQVQRGDGIIQNMNRFAHSVDASENTIRVNDLLALMVALSNRFAAMREITLELAPAHSQVEIVTNEYELENLIWACLDFAMQAAGQKGTILLETEDQGNTVRIKISSQKGFETHSDKSFPGNHEHKLIEGLKAELAIDPDRGEIIVSLPPNIRQ